MTAAARDSNPLGEPNILQNCNTVALFVVSGRLAVGLERMRMVRYTVRNALLLRPTTSRESALRDGVVNWVFDLTQAIVSNPPFTDQAVSMEAAVQRGISAISLSAAVLAEDTAEAAIRVIATALASHGLDPGAHVMYSRDLPPDVQWHIRAAWPTAAAASQEDCRAITR